MAYTELYQASNAVGVLLLSQPVAFNSLVIQSNSTPKIPSLYVQRYLVLPGIGEVLIDERKIVNILSILNYNDSYSYKLRVVPAASTRRFDIRIWGDTIPIAGGGGNSNPPFDDSLYLKKAENLNDLASKVQALVNLGLDLTPYALKSALNNLAAIVYGKAATSANLSDLAQPALARGNIGVVWESWQSATINAGFTVVYPVRFRRNFDNNVQIEGAVTTNLAPQFDRYIFRLPVGYRPYQRKVVSTATNVGASVLLLETNGQVSFYRGDGASSYLSLDMPMFESGQAL